MKQFLSVLFSIIIVSSLFIIPATAVSSPAESNDPVLTDILKETNKDLISDILTSAQWDASMQELEPGDEPMVLTYYGYSFEYTGESFDEMISHAHSSAYRGLTVLREVPVSIQEYQRGSKLKAVSCPGPIPVYIQDILDGKAVQTFFDTSCTVTNVICFDSYATYSGVVAIYDTDKGRFIRYYPDRNAESTEYTWDYFVEKVKAYNAYVSSYENNYDIFGSPKNGRLSFLTYLENPNKYNSEPGSYIWIYILFGILALCIIGTVLSAILSHIRKRKVSRN